MVETRAQRRRKEKESVMARYRIVLNDIEECRPEKILLVCIRALPPYSHEFDPPMDQMPEHINSCYEGAYRFSLYSGGCLFWPMKQCPYSYMSIPYENNDFSIKQLKYMWQNKFFLR